MTALAGEFDESKHSRAEDGKFGSGPGTARAERTPHGRAAEARYARDAIKSGKEAKARGEKQAQQEHVSARHAAATERRNEAMAAHTEARGAYDKAVADHEQAAGGYERQNEQDKERAPAVRARLFAEHQAAKAHAAKLDKAEQAVVEKHGISRSEHASLLFAQQAEERHAHNVTQAQAPGASSIAKQRAASSAAALEAAAVRAKPTREKLTPEEHRTLIESANATNAVLNTRDGVRDIDRGLRNEPKITAAKRELKAATERGDEKAAAKMAKKLDQIDSSSTLRGALAAHDPEDKAPAELDPAESAAAVASARKKLERSARALKLHEREVARTGKKVDADGDGRTGDAEETDDKDPA